MKAVTLSRGVIVIAAGLAGLFLLGRCGDGNMVSSPRRPPGQAPTPLPVPTAVGSSAASLYGRVVDNATGEPLEDVNVTLLQSGGGYHSSRTGADGTYRIDDLVPLLPTSLRASKVGYLNSTNTFRPQGALHYDIAITKYRTTPGKTEYAD